MTLQEFFKEHPSVAIGFSGGVDSSYLLYEALKHAKEILCYFVKTPFGPRFELEDAKKISKELQTELIILEEDVLGDELVRRNEKDRCYHCKKLIFSRIKEDALNRGVEVILDGTNASDDLSDRPGYKALQELGVLSPLRLCDLTKEMIREHLKEANLFTWKKPSYACLATRIPTGKIITMKDLKRVEWAEDYLRELGFIDFRVRMTEEGCRLELTSVDMEKLMMNRVEVLSELKKEFKKVYLDLEER
ncbi:ATP-dependent sacrificial sulfur transferase LarE [Guggenheimella bovis]